MSQRMRRERDQAEEPAISGIEEWLRRLDTCCREPNTAAKGREQFTQWPNLGHFEGLMLHVQFHGDGNKRLPQWKTMERLNKRQPSLRLVRRVNQLVERAKQRLTEAGESHLGVLERQATSGRKDAKNLLLDVAQLCRNLSTARKIDWSQHEKVLAQFSRTGSIELACGLTAPPEVRCYARTLELIVDDHRHEFQTKPSALLSWLHQIGHPGAQELFALDHVVALRANRRKQLIEKYELKQKRKAGRERVRRHRAKNSLPTIRYKGNECRL
jgi:hypothetical protein